jgi:hypothetical protein
VTIFTLKGPGLLAAITRLGCTVHVDEFVFATAYTVTRGNDMRNTVATFDLCPDGAFRFGTVHGIECTSWHEFDIELQEAVRT